MNKLGWVCALLWLSVPVTASPAIAIPRLRATPRLGTRAPQDWGTARLGRFTQKLPSDGAAPTEHTQVYVGYDAAHLYLWWVCSDRQPRAIRAHLSPRDTLTPGTAYTDDFVAVTLDPFQTRQHAYFFGANPLGVETDGLWEERSASLDTSWDATWDATGRISGNGYQVLMTIPFGSLRLPAQAVQSWGVTFERYIARRDEADYWPPVSARIAGLLNQQGTLTSMQPRVSDAGLRADPYLFGRAYSSPAASRRFQPRAGADLQAALPSGLVLDATLNPDFSQIESDEPQIAVNKPFANFYPEKRPFFLADASLFHSAASALGLSKLLFTREIADPVAGAKLSGSVGRWDVALLTAEDRSPGESVAPGDADFGHNATLLVGRVARNIGSGSSLGGFVSDRELAGGYNRVVAADASLHLNANWSAFFRQALSVTDCSNGSSLCLTGLTAYSAQQPLGHRTGWDGIAYLAGSGRHFSLNAQYQDISPNFHTDTGFVPQTDLRNLYGYYHYYFRPEGTWVINWGPETNLQRIWDHTGRPTSYQLNLSPYFGMRHDTRFWFPILARVSQTVRPQDFAG